MSRCQHGQQITQFCINDTCNWRQPGGCQQCLKKYHNHIHLQPTDIIDLNKLQQMHKLYSLKSQIKPKSRILQQAVYNYFIIMKSQISSSIDNISRIITNRLNYPYLFEEGQLSVYRKIKNKQYKKINKKQLKNFYNFTNTQNKDIIQLNQKKLYKYQVQQLTNTMKNINQSFLLYAKSVQKLDNTFNVQRSFLNKIYQIANSIQKTQSTGNKSYEKIQKISTNSQQSVNSQQYGYDKDKQKSNKQLKDSKDIKQSISITPLTQQQPVIQSRPSRDRKVSLDFSVAGGIDINKFSSNRDRDKQRDRDRDRSQGPTKLPGQISSNNSNIDQNEKQIYQRKKKLFDMINNPQSHQSQQSQQVQSKSRQYTSINNTSQTQTQNNKRNTKNTDISKSLEKNIGTNVTSLQNTPKKIDRLNLNVHGHGHTHGQQFKQIPSPIEEHQDQMLQSKISQASPTGNVGVRGKEQQVNQDKQDKEYKQDNQQRTQQQQRLQTQQTQQQQNPNNNQLDKDKAQLFQNLMNKGINLPQMILHTILPRQTSRPKLYEDTKDVKQRKITIPVKRFQHEEEISSPLFKQKKQRKLDKEKQKEENQKDGGGSGSGSGSGKDMGKISLFGRQDQADTIKQQLTDKDDKYSTPKKQDQRLLLKQKQADSLALLVQSLPLSAEKAIPLLQASIKYAHNNLSAAEYLSYLYLLIQKPKQCLQLCNKFLQQLQDSPQANQLSIHISNNKAAALNMLGRYSQSIGILQKCLAFTKRDIYYKNLGDAYFSIAIYEKAVFNYQNAIKMNNQMEQAFYNLAVCYYMQQHMHQAKLNVAKALKINPKNQEYLRLSREIMIKMQV